MDIAMLFPGQGSQYIQMCKKEAEQDKEVINIFEEASEILKKDLWDMIQNGKMSTLTLSENAQPAIVTASYVLYKKFIKETGIYPTISAGHSLGEISALVCAESISFKEGVALARQRGKLMQEALEEKCGFAGIILDLEEEQVLEIIEKVSKEGYVTVTGYNTPFQFMVGGEKKVARVLDDEVEKMNGQYIPFKMIPMKADAPYHSLLMKPWMPRLKELIEDIQYDMPKFPICSTVTGEVIKSKEEISDNLINQLIKPVKWNQVLHKIDNKGIDVFVDIGPNVITRNLVRENKKLSNIWAYDNGEDKVNILKLLLK